MDEAADRREMDEAADRREMDEAADKGMVVTEKQSRIKNKSYKAPFHSLSPLSLLFVCLSFSFLILRFSLSLQS